MTTQPPPHDGESLKAADQLPNWFLSAWQNDDVEIYPLAIKSFRYNCIVPVNHQWLTVVVIKFSVRKVDDYYYHIFDPRASFIFGKRPPSAGNQFTEWDWYLETTAERDMTNVLADIIDAGAVVRGDGHSDLVKIVGQQSNMEYNVNLSRQLAWVIKDQLTYVGEQLYTLAQQK